jgi:cytochrome c biogenesis protein CcdA
MEPEELKKTWSLLDEHLHRQEIQNTALMKENLLGKSNKRLGVMINYAYFGLACSTVGLIAVAYVAILLTHFGTERLPLTIISSVLVLFMLFVVVTELVGLIKLQKKQTSPLP